MNGSDRRSINSKGGMNGKSTNSETANSSVSLQLQEIYAKLQKLDDLEKLSKDLLGKLLQLAHRIDVNNKRTDAVLVKFWRVEDKGRFIRCILKNPLRHETNQTDSVGNKLLLNELHVTSTTFRTRVLAETTLKAELKPPHWNILKLRS
ncbi:hypothetical protein pipiens_008173 [Culex pipiens pipiens]|uniref:Uncharacterized protein n=1 Tax=Culex pipiens pipiens TaxID=38569 RepID=A0ABD1DIM0_CULPP